MNLACVKNDVQALAQVSEQYRDVAMGITTLDGGELFAGEKEWIYSLLHQDIHAAVTAQLTHFYHVQPGDSSWSKGSE